MPSQGTETVLHRIIDLHTRGGTYPYPTLLVGHQGHHPVVGEIPLFSLPVVIVIVDPLTCSCLTDAESSGKGTEIDISIMVDGHIVHMVAVVTKHLLSTACLWMIAVEGIVGAYPVVSVLITIDKLHITGSRGVTNHLTFGIEPIDTIALYGGPYHTVVSITNRGDRGTYTIALHGEHP